MIIQKLQKFIKITSKTQKAQNTSFPKEKVENTDLNKPVLNKVTTTQE